MTSLAKSSTGNILNFTIVVQKTRHENVVLQIFPQTSLLEGVLTCKCSIKATRQNATKQNPTQQNATQQNATQQNATQQNATQQNATQACGGSPLAG